MSRKPSIDDVRKARIIDPSFHSEEYNSFRDPAFYYSFVYCVSGYLKSTATKRFEKYNDSFFEVIGYLSDWGIVAAEPMTALTIIDKRLMMNLEPTPARN